ncbi:MAG: lipopolysaccharide kinase InaA family protein [Kiritimatiellae bacterium]|nr:lipopolysaccharide kinase InaA family protein [Kiritimatiellia bacterium]
MNETPPITIPPASSLYKTRLHEGSSSRSSLCGCWLPEPELSPERLRALVAEAMRDPEAVILKEDRRTTVLRTRLLGRDVMIKRYVLTKLSEQIKYAFRHSPARRFWAAARTMQAVRIPTPEPLGILEEYRLGIPIQRHMISEYLDHSLTLRQWIETSPFNESAEHKAAAIRQLLDLLLALYASGLYHRDTKGENILVTHHNDPSHRTLHWIDLECVQSKTRPSRHDIIRNLVQLNGSICHMVSKEDRMAFLKFMAEAHPWVLQPNTLQTIRQWTQRRLDKERHETR